MNFPKQNKQNPTTKQGDHKPPTERSKQAPKPLLVRMKKEEAPPHAITAFGSQATLEQLEKSEKRGNKKKRALDS